jgi:hypothetical protein
MAFSLVVGGVPSDCIGANLGNHDFTVFEKTVSRQLRKFPGRVFAPLLENEEVVWLRLGRDSSL